MSITNLIEEIADPDKPLVNSQLADLSQITVTELPLWKRIWATISIERRHQIISRLIELARDNVELNFDLIFKHALNDIDIRVRMEAIDGLWENEDPSLIKVFINMLQKDVSYDVQAAVAASLGRFAILAECQEIRDSYKNILQQALLDTINNKDKPPEVRRRALEAIAPLSVQTVREAIKQAYESRDERFIASSIYAMGKTCDNAWLPVIHKEMDNINAEIRYEAIGACGEIGSQESVPYLLEHIHDSDIEVQLSVIQSLARIGGIEAKKGLQRISRDNNTAVREAVNQAISEIETMEDMTLLQMDISGEQNDRWN